MNSRLIWTVLLAVIGPQTAAKAKLSEASFPVGASAAAPASNIFTVDMTSMKAGLKVDKDFYGSQMDTYIGIASTQNEPEAKLKAQYDLLESMMPLLPSLNIGRVRIGGNLYDNYDFESNLIYLSKRGLQATLPFQPIYSEDFSTFFKENNIKPMMQVNMLGAAPVVKGEDKYDLDTAFANEKTAAAFVTHLNSDPKTFVGDFSMGNEFEQWRDTNPDVIKSNKATISADDYIEKYIKYAVAMRKAQKKISGNPNDIKLWGPETSGSYMDWNTGNMIDEGGKDCSWHPSIKGRLSCSYTYGGKTFSDFVPYFLYRLAEYEKSAANSADKFKMLDYLSLHYYPNFRSDVSKENSYIINASGAQDVDAMLSHTEVWDNASFKNTKDISSYRDFSPNIFGRMNQWLAAYYPNAKLGVTEFAVDSLDATTGYHPVVRPLYLADSIGRAARNGVAYFAQAFLNVEAESDIPWTLIRGDRFTSQGEVLALFSNHFTGDVLQVAEKADSMVKAYAVMVSNVAGNEEMNIVVVNKSRKNQSVGISVKFPNGMVRPFLSNVSQPAWSVRVYNVKTKGAQVMTKTYGAAEMGVTVQ